MIRSQAKKQTYLIRFNALFLLLVFILMLSGVSEVQGQKWRKIMTELTDSKKAEKHSRQLNKLIIENSDNVLANFGLAVINRQAGDSKSLFKAWLFIDRAFTCFQSNETYPEKEVINKYVNNPPKRFSFEHKSIDSILWFKGSSNLDLTELRKRMVYLDNSRYLTQYKHMLTRLEYEQARKTNTLEAFERFLFLYPDATEAKDAIAQRDMLEFAKAKEKDMVFVYNEFIARHPRSAWIDEAIAIRDLKSWELVANTTDLDDLDFFIANYPTAPQVGEALEARYKLAFNQAVKTNTIEGYQYFIEHNPLTKYIPDAVARRDALVFDQLQQFTDCGAYQLFMSGMPFADKTFKAFLEKYSNQLK